jgi:hypothetical protein
MLHLSLAIKRPEYPILPGKLAPINNVLVGNSKGRLKVRRLTGRSNDGRTSRKATLPPHEVAERSGRGVASFIRGSLDPKSSANRFLR